MPKQIVFTMLLLLLIQVTKGQYIERSISRREANDLLKSLNQKMDDENRIDILLQLAEYNILKEGIDTGDRLLPAKFIGQASELKAKSKSSKYDGYLLLVQSMFAKRSGDLSTGKDLASKAILKLQAEDDNFHWILASLEFLRYTDSKTHAQVLAIDNQIPAILLKMEKISDSRQKAYCIAAFQNFYQTKFNDSESDMDLTYLPGLLATFQKINAKDGEIWVRKEMADLYLRHGQTKRAEKELLELLKFQSEGGFKNICFTYDLLAGLYFETSNYDNALKYSLLSIKSVKSALDSAYMPDFYGRTMGIYRIIGNSEQVYEWSMKLLEIDIFQHNTDEIYYTLNYAIEHLLKQGKPAEGLELILNKRKRFAPANIHEEKNMNLALARCYHALNNNDLAEKHFQKLLSLIDIQIAKGDKDRFTTEYQYIGWFYLDTRQYEKAKFFVKKAIDGWPVVGTAYRDLYESRAMFTIDSASGNFISAIKRLQFSQKVNDSLFNAEKSKQIEQLKISYETEQKDQMLKLNEQNIQLLTNQDQLQKSQLRQGAILRNIGFGVIALLIIIMALLYNRYRLKQRTNSKLELQQNEIEKQNISLRHLVNEKDWLVKEIHHRVKNNLQTVMGLLGTQSGYLKNDIAINAITDSQRRIQAMSLIHQRLYQSNSLSTIKMTDYIHELIDSLRDSFGINPRIRFNIDVERTNLDLAHCIPLGLILNEAITNSFKYAFPDNQPGTIAISLKNISENEIWLIVKDNGTGLPAGFNISRSDSMGMALMKGLSAEIGAECIISNENGTRIDIRFVYEPESTTEFSDMKTETLQPA